MSRLTTGSGRPLQRIIYGTGYMRFRTTRYLDEALTMGFTAVDTGNWRKDPALCFSRVAPVLTHEQSTFSSKSMLAGPSRPTGFPASTYSCRASLCRCLIITRWSLRTLPTALTPTKSPTPVKSRFIAPSRTCALATLTPSSSMPPSSPSLPCSLSYASSKN